MEENIVATTAEPDELSQFHTRTKSEEGVHMPLSTPDGRPTEHWLRIRGIDSDSFRIANTKAQRRAIEIAQETDEAERDRLVEEERLKVLAALVAGWSFKRELTAESALGFLREAPQIAGQVDQVAYKRALFFVSSSTPSSPTPEGASS